MLIKKSIDRSFVSEIDKRLAEFDRTHAKTASQLAEIDKYDRVYKLRDHAIPQQQEKDIWDFS